MGLLTQWRTRRLEDRERCAWAEARRQIRVTDHGVLGISIGGVQLIDFDGTATSADIMEKVNLLRRK